MQLVIVAGAEQPTRSSSAEVAAYARTIDFAASVRSEEAASTNDSAVGARSVEAALER